jgi:hypothetical protein
VHSAPTRVDELPVLMERDPDTAIYLDKVKNCSFPFLAKLSA